MVLEMMLFIKATESLATKAKNRQRDCSPMESFQISNKTANIVQRSYTIWKKTFARHLADRGLISTIAASPLLIFTNSHKVHSAAVQSCYIKLGEWSPAFQNGPSLCDTLHYVSIPCTVITIHKELYVTVSHISLAPIT